MELPGAVWDGTGGSALLPPLADRCFQLRRDAAAALSAGAEQCRAAAADWATLSERLDVLETWLDEQTAAERQQDAEPDEAEDQTLLGALAGQQEELAGCAARLDTVVGCGRVSAAACRLLSARLAAAGRRLDAADGRLRGRRELVQRRRRLRPRLDGGRRRLQLAREARQLRQLPELTQQLAAAAELGQELHQLCGTAPGPEDAAEPTQLLQVRDKGGTAGRGCDL